MADALVKHFKRENSLLFICCFGLAYLFFGPFFMPDTGKYRTVAYLLFFLPALVYLVRNRKITSQSISPPFLVAAVAFLAFTVLNTLWADATAEFGAAEVLRYSLQIIIFGLMASVIYSNHPALFTGILYTTIVICSVFAIYRITDFYYLHGKDFSERLTGQGVLWHPVIGMCYLGFIQAIILVELLTSRVTARKAFFLVASSIPIFTAITLTQSRTILVGLLAATLACLLLSRQSRKYILIAFVIVFSAVYYYFFHYEITKRGFSMRPALAVNTVVAGMQAPLFGHGYSTVAIIPYTEEAASNKLSREELLEQAATASELLGRELEFKREMDELRKQLQDPAIDRKTRARVRKQIHKLKEKIELLHRSQQRLEIIEYQTPHNMHATIFFFGGLTGAGLFGWMILLVLRNALHKLKQENDSLPLGLLVYGQTILLTMGHLYVNPPDVNWFYLWIPLFLAASITATNRVNGPASNPA